MKTYFIYHILGIKIGCTSNIKTRNWQNKKKYGTNIEITILETYHDPQVAGDREWELADEYGYPKGQHYMHISQQGVNLSKEAQSIGGQIGGVISGRGNVESGHLKSIAPLGGVAVQYKNSRKAQVRVVCQYCNKEVNKLNYGRWHGDNCKHKKTLTN